jgi:glycosyltransferase involved in cell wall biosynthesis
MAIKKRDLKVLQLVGVLPSSRFPSAQPFVSSQIDSLRKAGVEIDVLDLATCCGKGWKKYIRGIFKIRKMVSSNQYDLIHAHYSYCGWVAKFQRRVPVVVSLMGSDLSGTPDIQGRQTWRGRIDRMTSLLLVYLVEHIIVKSQWMATQVPRKNGISVLPNGVDSELFRPMTRSVAREHFKMGEKGKVILFAANPANPRKNYALAQKAVNTMNGGVADSPNLLWPFYNQPHEEVPLAMNAADVLLLASFHEGSPNVVKEAMACNLPIVSVRVGDVAEIISGVRHCYIADYDPNDIATKLALVLESGERSDGRQYIENLRLEVVADRLAEIYSQVLEKVQRSNQAQPFKRQKAVK